MAKSVQKIKAHCNNCLGERNHDVLHEEHTNWEELVDNRFSVSGGDIYRMLRCGGCDHVNLQQSSWCSEDFDPETGRPEHTVTYFPPAISKAEPGWLNKLTYDDNKDRRYIGHVLREIYSALHNDSRRLAVMGVRALLEHLMISTMANDYGSFATNLNNFEAQGNLSAKQRRVLESILEAGHATIHRGYNPSAPDVTAVVELAESLVATIIIHPEQSDALKKRVPKRKKKVKKKHAKK